MSVFEHSRFRIFNPAQHPLKHDITDFAYGNPRLPGVSLLGDALDAIVASIYPNYQGTVATPGDLPGTANPNDYYIVTDDGDGKSAGYVWSVIDNAGSWIKRYDVDWSFENILAETVSRTMPMYVHKYGFDDRDENGTITGVFAGQHIYGGESANSNLTLHANSGDTAGAHTGFVQVDDDFRPAADSAYLLGTNTERWQAVYTDALFSGTMAIASGSITDSSGTIDFGDEDLNTTGVITAANISASGSADFAGFTLQDIAGPKGEITHTSGQISFGSNDLETTGSITVDTGAFTTGLGVGPLAGDILILAPGSITDESGAIDFDDENLSTTGTLSAGATTVSSLSAGNLAIAVNTLFSTDTNGDLNLAANGTGTINFLSSFALSGTGTITGQLNVDNLRLDGNTVSTTDTNGNLILAPNGAGEIEFGAPVYPATDSAWDLGKSGHVWNKLWIDGSIGGASSEITLDDLLSLRSAPYRDSARTTPAQAGDSLFWDGTQWLANHPDTEISHSEVSGLTTGDAGHTQFVMLTGRAGGQSIQGGTAASQNLTLESTSHATKGAVYTKDVFAPFTNASFSSSWSGTDLGDSTHAFRDVYTAGEFKGLRLENFTEAGLPSASGSKTGRAAWTTDTKRIFVDTGGAWLKASVGRFISDTTWSAETTKTIDVSSGIADARNAIFQLLDNANDFATIYCSLKRISATQVQIEVEEALTGSFRLLGLE